MPTPHSEFRTPHSVNLRAWDALARHNDNYIGATPHNLAELKQATRTPGIKIFIGSSTGELLVDDQAALEAIFAETTLPICAHCEDEATIRATAARLAGTTNVADHSRVREVPVHRHP